MTKIKLHGIIAKEFVESFELNVSSAKEVFDAIDANNPKFKKRILELSKKGMNFTILVDGNRLECTKELNIKRKYKRIDIVPAIMGKGPVSAVVTWVANAALVLLTLAAIYGVYLLITSLLNKPDAPDISQTVGAFEESYAFSNKANIVKQGFPVPVGYGRLYVGSNVIRSVEKNYPQNREPLDFFSIGEGVASSSKVRPTLKSWPKDPPTSYYGWGGTGDIVMERTHLHDPDKSHGYNSLQIFNCWEPISVNAFAYYAITFHYGGDGTNAQRFVIYRRLGVTGQDLEQVGIYKNSARFYEGTGIVNYFEPYRYREYILAKYPAFNLNLITGEGVLAILRINAILDYEIEEFNNGWELSNSCSTVSYPECNRGGQENYLSSPPDPTPSFPCLFGDNTNIPNFNIGASYGLGGEVSVRTGGASRQGEIITYNDPI